MTQPIGGKANTMPSLGNQMAEALLFLGLEVYEMQGMQEGGSRPRFLLTKQWCCLQMWTCPRTRLELQGFGLCGVLWP